MTRNWKKAARVLAPALLLPLWSCGTKSSFNSPGGVITPDPIETEPVAYGLESRTLEFLHVVGDSPCPQLVGTIGLTNRSTTQRMRYRLRGDGAGIKPLDLPMTSDTLDPGETQEIKVFFDCSQTLSFITVLTFDLTNEASGKTDVAEVRVIGTIRFQ